MSVKMLIFILMFIGTHGTWNDIKKSGVSLRIEDVAASGRKCYFQLEENTVKRSTRDDQKEFLPDVFVLAVLI